MADLYRIEITDLTDDEVQARLVLINVQVPDLPAKKNIAMQVVTEFFYDRHWKEHEFINAFSSDDYARWEQLETHDKLLCLTRLAFHSADRYALFIERCAEEIEWVKYVGDANFDRIQEWEEAKYDERQPEIEPWTEIRFRIRNRDLLQHLNLGAKMNSTMFDKTE